MYIFLKIILKGLFNICNSKQDDHHLLYLLKFITFSELKLVASKVEQISLF